MFSGKVKEGLEFRRQNRRAENGSEGFRMKGFGKLQDVVNRKGKAPDWKLSQNRSTLSKSAQAVTRFYNEVENQPALSLAAGYRSQVRGLQRAFLLRPGCPRFSSKATTTAQFDPSISSLSDLPTSGNIRFESWDMVDGQPTTIEPVTEGTVSFSQSAGEIRGWRSFSEVERVQAAVQGSSTQSLAIQPPGHKIPWYVAVIHEKERCMLMLGEEINRLSKVEMECQRKDDVIQVLREEVEKLDRQLQTQRKLSSKQEEESIPVPADLGARLSPVPGPGVPGEEPRQGSHIEGLKEEVVEDLKARLSLSEQPPDATLETEIATLSESLMKGQEELQQLEREYSEIQLKDPRQEETSREGPLGENKAVGEMGPEAEEGVLLYKEVEEELLAKLQESEQVNQELQEVLDSLRNEYSVATGVISSLQRQVDFQKSQLCKAEVEQEKLRKELRERQNQLQAMSTKFSCLREERKLEEMMGAIEKDNFALRQHVCDLESELGKRIEQIGEFGGRLSWLEGEVTAGRNHLERQQRCQAELQSQNELERLRNRIIQATFSTAGIKSPNSEISDSDILDALQPVFEFQRLINERVEFHQMLKQKGVKVPPLHQTEITSANHRPARRSPAK
ncbi:coiled-coil domain-containing protein 27 isoform X3 [Ornithorhynchus anatinus]|uniref:coiled-coil domain-containing protein 27 isoform X3 n=1 Tax=Ornithorhynchus anatinus TaxID=9258 RepID=UPI0010A77ABA|nr:coiled-coil domain-containing protein 27 isoform X3 [Ornithorhynchus anatinus]